MLLITNYICVSVEIDLRPACVRRGPDSSYGICNVHIYTHARTHARTHVRTRTPLKRQYVNDNLT